MCERYALTSFSEDIGRSLASSDRIDMRRGNVAPLQFAPALRLDGAGSRRLSLLRWGLVPSWAPDLSFGAICTNARAETITTRPAFRHAVRRRRCLVPADAYYEWKVVKGRVQLHRVESAAGSPFTFAGLWESWQSPEGQTTETFALVTVAPSAVHIRDGQPVIIEARDHNLWLDPSPTQFDRQLRLLRPLAAGRLKATPVERVREDRDDHAPLNGTGVDRAAVDQPTVHRAA